METEEQAALDALLGGVDIEPRPYQTRIIAQAISMFAGEHTNRVGELEPPAHSVLIESPTGSGKTIMGLAVARHLARQGLRIGWVAMRRNLLAQAERENRRRGFDVDLEQISMFDKEPPKVDVLIVDEAQHDAAMSMANLHCLIRPRFVLGLSATPYRTDRVKLCFDKVITDAGIQRLITDGYLSPYHHYTIPEYTPETVARFYAEDPRRWGKSLIFFHRLDQCRDCADRLAAAGHAAEIVTAHSNRLAQLEAFEQGEVNILINMAILTEGFDCPTLKTVFCRPSGKSCTIQMGGRVFRKHPDLPHKQIVQCGATKHPFLRTAMPRRQFVWTERQWRTLTVNDRIDSISRQTRRMLARAKVALPETVAAHRARPLPWQRGESA